MLNYCPVRTQAEMLLTSAGPTTEAMQERLLELSKISKSYKLNVLRIADGLKSFTREDGVSITGQAEQRIEAITSRKWSNRYLKYVMGNVAVKTVNAAHHESQSFGELLKASDMLVVPGGNTYQTMRGLAPHKELIQDYVYKGLPYIGDSAGTIVAGINLTPASLEPADTKPSFYNGFNEMGLALLEADIIVHATGREGKFDIPGAVSKIAGLVLSSYETSQEDVNDFVDKCGLSGLQTFVLHDKQAVSVSAGVASII